LLAVALLARFGAGSGDAPGDVASAGMTRLDRTHLDRTRMTRLDRTRFVG